MDAEIKANQEKMNGNTTGSFKWMGIGTGSTAPSSTQTALVDTILRETNLIQPQFNSLK